MAFGWPKKKGEVVAEPVAAEGITEVSEDGSPVVGEKNPVSVSGESSAIEAATNLAKFRQMHRWDPHMNIERLDVIDQVVESGDVEKEAAFEESLLGEDSPYAEVRSSVSSLFFL